MSHFDWPTVVKPLLAAAHGSLNMPDLVKLAKAIAASEKDILSSSDDFEGFYSAFVALSSHYFSANCANVPHSSFPVVQSACRVLIQFILSRLQNERLNGSVAQKQYVLLIKSLCKGIGFLQRTDIISLTALLKSSQLPPHIRSTIGPEKAEGESIQPQPTPKSPSSKSPTSMGPKSDMLSRVMQSFTTSIRGDFHGSDKLTSADVTKDLKEHFMEENLRLLVSLNAGTILIGKCCQLPYLMPFVEEFRKLRKGAELSCLKNPEFLENLRLSYNNTLNDVVITARVISLPILEPLTAERLEQLTELGCSCLVAALGMAAAQHSRGTADTNEQLESVANNIVEKSMAVFVQILCSIQHSNQAGGGQVQNFRALGCWTLAMGLKQLLSEEFSHDYITLGLCNQCLALFAPLVSEVKQEPLGLAPVELFDVNSSISAGQRLAFIDTSVPIIPLLFTMLDSSFQQALMLANAQEGGMNEGERSPKAKEISDAETVVRSTKSQDSTVERLSESGLEQSEAEPLIGSWLEKVLSSVPALVETALREKSATSPVTPRPRRSGTTDSLPSFLLEKSELQNYLSVAVNATMGMINFALTPYCRQEVGSKLTSKEIRILANIEMELDLYLDNHGTDTKFSELINMILKLQHNLLALDMVPPSMQDELLSYMGVNIESAASTDPWPLQLSCRALNLVGQILMLRSRPGKHGAEATVVIVWERFLNTITRQILRDERAQPADINVEHLQLLLFLFHSLTMMPKKTILLKMCEEIVLIAQNESSKCRQPCVQLGRLLQIFEYAVKHFYDPPAALLEHVVANVCPLNNSLESSGKSGKGLPILSGAKHFFPYPEIEDTYRVTVPYGEQKQMKPLFYHILPPENSGFGHEVPRLDGLASSFIQSSFSYDRLYDAVLSLTQKFDRFGTTDTPSTEDLCVMQFVMTISWKMAMILPPSIKFMGEVGEQPLENLTTVQLIQVCRVGERFRQTQFATWIKDSLIKQGATAIMAESLMKTVGDRFNSPDVISQTVDVLMKRLLGNWHTLTVTRKTWGQPNPSFVDCVNLDVAVGKIHAVLDVLQRGSEKSAKQYGTTLDTAGIPVGSVIGLVENFLSLSRCLLIDATCEKSPGGERYPCTPHARSSLGKLMSVCSGYPLKVAGLGLVTWSYVHPAARLVLDEWTKIPLKDFPNPLEHENVGDAIPVESFLSSVVAVHFSTLKSTWPMVVMSSSKRLLHSGVQLLCDILQWYPQQPNIAAAGDVLLSVTLDITSDFTCETACSALSILYGPSESDPFMGRVYRVALNACYDLLVETGNRGDWMDDKIGHECLKFMEYLLDKAVGRSALEATLTQYGDASRLLLSGTNSSTAYGYRLLQLFSKMFQTAESVTSDDHITNVCQSLLNPAALDLSLLPKWLMKMISSGTTDGEDQSPLIACRSFLTAFCVFLSKQTSCAGVETANALLSALLPPVGNILLSPSIPATTGLSFYTAVAVATMERIAPSPTSSLRSGGMRGYDNAFCSLFPVLCSLASVGSANGHVKLLVAASEWIDKCRGYLRETEVLDKIANGSAKGTHNSVMSVLTCLLHYVSEVMQLLLVDVEDGRKESVAVGSNFAQLGYTGGTAGYDSDSLMPEADQDWAEEFYGPVDDEESNDESDTDEANAKLCTFQTTQKEFINQHWYHCHTCGMVDGEGVCTTCAKVCHKDHDLSYSKFGSFFCDCGAKQDGTCRSLTKRPRESSAPPAPSNDLSSTGNSDTVGSTTTTTATTRHSLLRYSFKPIVTPSATQEGNGRSKPDRTREYIKSLGDSKEQILEELKRSHKGVVEKILELATSLVPAVISASEAKSPIGAVDRLKMDLEALHSAQKLYETSDNLAFPSLGSGEGAFENVRLQFSGDQGSTIRQLLSAHVISRQSLACLSNPAKKRQHLAVCHDKGKITILQLSALLKQADMTKKKLTLTRLSYESVPFTILAIADNTANEDYLAVSGLKECQILALSGTQGTVNYRISVKPSLEAGNFIIKPIWLPGSQSELALVTADFVRIYDLSKDAQNAQFHFLVPTGKIRDATFAFWEKRVSPGAKPTLERHLILMSSSGHVYIQKLSEECESVGQFYVTTMFEIKHGELKDSGNQVGGGGVSIYYSHQLQLLFTSYQNGKSFIIPLREASERAEQIFPLVVKSIVNLPPPPPSAPGTTGRNGNTSNGPPALVRWAEIQGCPGLISCFTHSTMTPIVLFVRPDVISIQELKLSNSKTKLVDIIPIHHVSSPNEPARSSLILLCEDGSLRIHTVNAEQTGFWVRPASQPLFAPPPPVTKVVRKRTKSKAARGSPAAVDFFESCEVLGQHIDFGGPDFLQVYNTQQLKTRLNTNNLYVACGKSSPMQLEVVNNDPNMVICGIRVELGKHSLDRSPTSIEVFGRSRPIFLTRARWYDIPFTREESILARNRFNITFGPTAVVESGATFIDTVKVYGKTKEAFGWPDEVDETIRSATPSAQPVDVDTADRPPPVKQAWSSASSVTFDTTTSGTPAAAINPTVAERLVMGMLDITEDFFILFPDLTNSRQTASHVASDILTASAHCALVQKSKSLLSHLFPTKQEYHDHKDRHILSFVMRNLPPLAESLDPELYYSLLLMVRSVAVQRAHSLVNFTSEGISETDSSSSCSFIQKMVDLFWKIHGAAPLYPAITSVSDSCRSFTQEEATVRSLVEILHSLYLVEPSIVPLAAKLYGEFLFAEDLLVSGAAKHTLCVLLRPRMKKKRVQLPSLSRETTPVAVSSANVITPPLPAPVERPQPPVAPSAADVYDQMLNHAEVEANQLEALLAVAEAAAAEGNDDSGEGQMFEVDADDEAMVELAIALSLQEGGGGGGGVGGVSFADLIVPIPQEPHGIDESAEGNFSDATVSGPSDDEGSNAATEGSTLEALRTSPNEERDRRNELRNSPSESGGSGVESVSGRSSAYGEGAAAKGETGQSASAAAAMHSSRPEPPDPEADEKMRLHSLNVELLEHIVTNLPGGDRCDGLHAIAFMQVLLALASDLNSDNDLDREAFHHLLSLVISKIHFHPDNYSLVFERSKGTEVELILLRFLSVVMSKYKGRSRGASESDTFVAQTTATALTQQGAIEYCMKVLESLLDYWTHQDSEDIEMVGHKLVVKKPDQPVCDLSPFFMQQYVKEHARDVFANFPLLVTEMVLRLPYQMKKIFEHSRLAIVPEGLQFDPAWNFVLCEFVVSERTAFVRKQARRLLLYICGTREKYRQLRDSHTLKTQMAHVKLLCKVDLVGLDATRPLSLDYTSLSALMEHLRICNDIASSRPGNWQTFCMEELDTVEFLLRLACVVEEGVCSSVLSLLTSAFCQVAESKSSKKEEPKTEDADWKRQKFSQSIAECLANRIWFDTEKELLVLFIRQFLLICNTSERRWQAHSLLAAVLKLCQNDVKMALLDLIWERLWPEVPFHGKRAVQLVDLLAYFMLSSTLATEKLVETSDRIVTLLRRQNAQMRSHPNAGIYNVLRQLLDSDGNYLESNPCIVCNNPEVPFATTKLSTLKTDARYTTSSHIVKLVGSFEISRITLRISDIKRTKMIKRINLYSSNKSVPSVVELKNKPDVWSKPRKFTLTQGQTELRMDFSLPIIASSLMIEYADFYDVQAAAAETLQCPRCSASVPATPGVCGNCGENVYQCHKCRSINYDEKDPFVCNACGFCKYGKFEYTLNARPCVTVEPINNEEDRKKAIININLLLEKADNIYRQLQAYRPQVETLLAQLGGHDVVVPKDEVQTTTKLTAGGAPVITTTTQPVVQSVTSVCRPIQQLAVKYCRDCKGSFDELSKIVQKILACRKELLRYDHHQGEMVVTRENSRESCAPMSSNRCYGCIVSSIDHCVLLLRALCTVPATRLRLSNDKALLNELYEQNLRHGPSTTRNEVKELLIALTKDLPEPTNMLNALILSKINAVLREPGHSSVAIGAVQYELDLLGWTIKKFDSCWEQRVRCAFQIFLESLKHRKEGVLEAITLPCLRMIQNLITPPAEVKTESTTPRPASLGEAEICVSVASWLNPKSTGIYDQWVQRRKKLSQAEMSKENIRHSYLTEKYGRIWMKRCSKSQRFTADLSKDCWLLQGLFSANSTQMRQISAVILKQMAMSSSLKKAAVLDLLVSYLDKLGDLGERATEFVDLFKSLIEGDQWKYYLAVRGIIAQLSRLIFKEVERLNQRELQMTPDLSQGHSVKVISELLISFFHVDVIQKRWKNQSGVVGAVLNAYLTLRRLLVQRTKHTDDAQARLLELLELLTSGTESETTDFMAVCIRTLDRYPLNDVRTPVFIFERLCSIIFPEEKAVGEFLINIEKDSAQEDFLQGRMMGNPYNSLEPGMGPLMRDIKNKICRDCDLIALLEDDTGMELLVQNKIISLDLPVAEVYRKIWEPNHPGGEAMLVVYRMRGLLGDATEEFISALDAKKDDSVDQESVFRHASVLAECGGLDAMLQRLKLSSNQPQSQALLAVLLKLFDFCVKVQKNRQKLITHSLPAMEILLEVLLRLIDNDSESSVMSERLVAIIEALLLEANELPPDAYEKFANSFGTEVVGKMLAAVGLIPDVPAATLGITLRGPLIRLLGNLTLGHEERMNLLIAHFKSYVEFNRYDYGRTPVDTANLESFGQMTETILKGPYGDRLKGKLIEAGFIKEAAEYLQMHCPPLFKVGSTIDAPEWKEYLSKPSLKFVLKILAGLCKCHEETQLLVAADCIPIIHRLEQISTEEYLGSLSENLMERLKENPQVAKKIEEVRKETRAQKKRMAMAMREKQLGEMGMKANEKGQVRVDSSLLKQMSEIHDEAGLICSICREGYKFHPQKVLGIYVFVKRVPAEEFELKSKKKEVYSSVTHFNVVHFDCHQAAVRSIRNRDEWVSAELHNANTKCNGLLPLWAPQVAESVFVNCLARYNSHIQEASALNEVSFLTSVHDLKLLLWKFAADKSFSEDSGGGGKESNILLIPYLAFLGLYVMNTTKSIAAERGSLRVFLDLPAEKWVENAFEPEGSLFYAAVCLLVMSPSEWADVRLKFLRRLLVTSQARCTSGGKVLIDRSFKDYPVYRPYLLFFSLVDGLYKRVFDRVEVKSGEDWSVSLADYIRRSDAVMSETGVTLLEWFEREVIVCESFAEWLDVMGLLNDISSPDDFMRESFEAVPSP